MNDRQWANVGKWAALPWVLFIVAMCVSTCYLRAQTGPCLRFGNTLQCYIGPTQPGGRIAIGTTSSAVTTDYGPLYAEATINPDVWYSVDELRVIDSRDAGEDRDTGWIRFPIPDVRIESPYGSGNWILDPNMWIQAHYARAEIGLCSVSACGAVIVLGRVPLDRIVSVPTTKRRAISQ